VENKLEYNQVGNSQKLGFKLIVSAINTSLHQEFLKAFEGFPEVEVVFNRFEDTNFDCVVSAANSFGLMDGGVDQCITDYFGLQMMRRVQSRIIQEFAGEQPVGTSIIVRGLNFDMIGSETRFDRMKFVAHTPTMRVPRDVNGSDHAYKAMKAALLAVKAHNHIVDTSPQGVGPTHLVRINSVVTPGLATLAGRVPHDVAAKQMALAVYHVMNPPSVIDWYYASERDAQIQESR
jgi:O-acetyl-ADP-ribose deacetylase (regulator of RNase III)